MSGSAKERRPFLGIREVTLGDASIAAMEKVIHPHGVPPYHVTDRIFQKYKLPNWNVSRLRT